MRNKKNTIATRTITYCAMLAALSVVLARLVALMPDPSTHFSIEAIPIFLSGMFFGPLAGGLVGFTADFVGCLFSPFGYNPMFCIPPILYGVCGGLFRHFLAKGKHPVLSILRLILSFLPAVVLGSILYQSFALNLVYYNGAPAQFLIFLSTRSIQFAITTVINVVVIHLLLRSRVFHRLGVWPPVK